MASPSSTLAAPSRYWKVALVSIIFFHITAATFTSLGVALPFMIEELAWSWSAAGLGFSVLSFMVGITGWLPAVTLERFGTAATYGLGAAIMCTGFILLATTNGLTQYFVGAGLAGLGYTLCASVAGVAVVNQYLPEKRAMAIGAYLTIGGLGGVAGPILVTQIVEQTGTWRMHWWAMAGSIALLGGLAMFSLRNTNAEPAPNTRSETNIEAQSSDQGRVSWTLTQILRTPQFYVIVTALTLTLFGGVTTNTWAVTHMGNLGIAVGVAAAALSTHALVNALSRALGGALNKWIDSKWLLVSALAAEILGMAALSVADNPIAITLFVIGEGYGFGMCMFATTMLLVDYYGPDEAPKSMGTMHFITTVAMLGPVLGGYVADSTGSFAMIFQVYGVLLAICLIATIAMNRPALRNSQATQVSHGKHQQTPRRS